MRHLHSHLLLGAGLLGLAVSSALDSQPWPWVCVAAMGAALPLLGRVVTSRGVVARLRTETRSAFVRMSKLEEAQRHVPTEEWANKVTESHNRMVQRLSELEEVTEPLRVARQQESMGSIGRT